MAVAAVECVRGGWGSPVTICMSATPARAWFVSLGQAPVAGRPCASVSRFSRLMVGVGVGVVKAKGSEPSGARLSVSL